MKKVVAALFLLSLSFLLFARPAGGRKKESKEVKLTGKVCCQKCELSEAKECGTVVVVTKDKKDIKYYFDAESDKKYHDDSRRCQEGDGSRRGYGQGQEELRQGEERDLRVGVRKPARSGLKGVPLRVPPVITL